MTPEKALELVGRYARLTAQIKDCKTRIGESLELCNGISGKRQEVDQWGMPTQSRDTDSKNRELDVHLTQWYYEPVDYYVDGEAIYESIDLAHSITCPHCYAAHLAIQERKAARKALGYVKATISRSHT